jgi:hypothetical protein
MKLRIKGNTARLRLSQSEVNELAAGRTVSDSIAFGPLPEHRLIYRVVVADEASAIRAELSDGVITFFLPPNAAREWAAGDVVSMEAEQAIGEEGTLRILIEKDFACLNPRWGEDEADMFPNPKAGTEC